ncbi:MAG TPA: glycosyltransferase [Nitriliruptorales bacterium]
MAVRSSRPRIGFVSTYPPTVCGLASFTSSLVGAIGRTRGTREELGVLRLVEDDVDAIAEDGVRVHRRDDQRSLFSATRTLNTFDAVSVQHEFGIYGGSDGREVLDLVAGLDVPVATTFHTMLADPTPNQRSIIEDLAAASQRSVVMSGTAAERLVRHYDVDPHGVTVIPHGAAARFRGPSLAAGGRPLILTWGLIGPGKGLEVAIEACTSLLDLDPRPRYLIAGATHPNVRRNDGEAYREGLVALVRRLGLEDVVEFDDRYLDDDELARVVRSADLVVLPYASVEQVTSGVLVEAVSASKPVIATSFPHSVEVLSSGAGMLVDHGDADALGAALRTVLTDPARARAMAHEAGRIAAAWDWPTIGRRYDGMFAGMAAFGRPRGAGVPQRVGVDHVAG